MGRGIGIHGLLQNVYGAGDVLLGIRFCRPCVHYDDVLAQGDGLPQVVGIGLVIQLVFVVCDLVFHGAPVS